MEDDREMRDGEAVIHDNSGDRSSRRDRSRSRERRRDRDDERPRRHSRSRSGSPGRVPRRRSYSRSRSRSRDRSDRRRDDRDRDDRDDRGDRRGDRDRRGERDRRSRSRDRGGMSSSGGGGGPGGRRRPSPTPLHGRGKFGVPRQEWEKSVGGPMNAPAAEAEAHAKVSKRENRLYIGNLAYDCNYKDLENFMKSAGEVVFSEILTTPAGQSKGCGIVEYATAEDAARAKMELADKAFMGRSVFIREDREETARFGQAPIPGKMGMANGESAHFLGRPGANPQNRNLFIGNLPMQASWQDLKDLMRQAGEVIRADVGMFPDGRPKGNGLVVFVNPEDAKAAIEMFNGFDWFGNVLEVREDRFAGGGPGGFRGGFGGGFGGPRGGFGGPGFGGRGGFSGGFGGRGGFGGGFGGGGFGGRGGFGGGFGGGRGGFGGGFGGGRGGYGGGHAAAAGGGGPGGAAGGRNFSNDLYADYNGPEGQNGAAGSAMQVDQAGSGLQPQPAEPNQQILVRNLPWSTSNEDLVELFETVGNVVTAEILYEGTRSKGEGIVQFTETAEAQTAGEKFSGYVYGGRPLDVQFNPRWHDFTSGAAKGTTQAA